MTTRSTASSSTDGGEPTRTADGTGGSGAAAGADIGRSDAPMTEAATADAATAPGPATAPDAATAAPEVDVGRRAFFRSFGKQALVTAAQVAGLANSVSMGSTNVAANLVGLGLGAAQAPPAPAGTRAGQSGVMGPAYPASDAAAAPRFRSAYRLAEGALYILDQRGLPERLEEQTCRRGSDVAFYLRVAAVRGGPIVGQLAAYGVALSAQEMADRAYQARQGEFRRVSRSILVTRPSSRMLRWTLDRLSLLWDSLPEEVTAAESAAAMRREADTLAMDAMNRPCRHRTTPRGAATPAERPAASPAGPRQPGLAELRAGGHCAGRHHPAWRGGSWPARLGHRDAAVP